LLLTGGDTGGDLIDPLRHLLLTGGDPGGDLVEAARHLVLRPSSA
jgi:hypothetical protein